MYYSCRFYINADNLMNYSELSLRIFDAVSDLLQCKIDVINYTVFNPDNDEILIDKCFPYSNKGKSQFLDKHYRDTYTGKYGDISTPFITAQNGKVKQFSLFDKVHIRIHFPEKKELPLIVSIDIDSKAMKNDFGLITYKQIIEVLSNIGCNIDNSLCHVFCRKNSTATIDCGQIGSVFGFNKKCVYASASHLHDYQGKLMGAFLMNSINKRYLDYTTENEIEEIMGIENTGFAGDNFVFAVQLNIRNAWLYRQLNHAKIRKVTSILNRQGLLSEEHV